MTSNRENISISGTRRVSRATDAGCLVLNRSSLRSAKALHQGKSRTERHKETLLI